MTKRQFELLHLLSCVPLLGIIPWFFFIVFGVMLFDAPGSEENPFTWLLFLTCLVYPAIVVYGFVTSYRGKRDTLPNKAFKGLSLSYCGPLLIVLASVALDYFCNGYLAC